MVLDNDNDNDNDNDDDNDNEIMLKKLIILMDMPDKEKIKEECENIVINTVPDATKILIMHIEK